MSILIIHTQELQKRARLVKLSRNNDYSAKKFVKTNRKGWCVGRLVYVCLSDLHAGADNSLLSASTSSPSAPSAVAAFGAALNGLLQQHHAHHFGANPAADQAPELLFLGDTLDMSFSGLDQAAQTYQDFLKVVVDPNLVSPQTRFIPGNHDQSLWTATRAATAARNIALDQHPLLPPATAGDPAAALDDPLLSAIHARAGLGPVKTSYPNLILSKEGRCVVLHHGHFCEPIYRAVSHLLDTLEGLDLHSSTVARLSDENAAWIEFGWSAFGGSTPALNRELQELYATVYVSSRANEVRRRIGGLLRDLVAARLPHVGAAMAQSIDRAIATSVDLALGSYTDQARSSVLSAVSEADIAELKWYLSGPVRRQLIDELGDIPQDLTFIHGHTHRPYCAKLTPGGGLPVTGLCNTGGWYLDSPMMNARQGVALVLIDDALNTLWVPCFSTPLNGSAMSQDIRLVTPETLDGKDFRDQICGWIETQADLWITLRETASRAYVRLASSDEFRPVARPQTLSHEGQIL